MQGCGKSWYASRRAAWVSKFSTGSSGKLEKPLGWRLSSFTGRQCAEFFTGQTSQGMWTGLSPVTPSMRDSLMIAFGQGEVVRAEREAAQPISLPLAPVVPFPRSN